MEQNLALLRDAEIKLGTAARRALQDNAKTFQPSDVALKIIAGKLEVMKFETGFDGIERVIAALHDAAGWTKQATKPELQKAAYWRQLAANLHAHLDRYNKPDNS